MKQFLYLDTDIVNSIIAQSQNGLEQLFKTDNTETVSVDTLSGETTNGSVQGKGNLFNLMNIGGQFGIESTDQDSKVKTNTTHEITEKILHDAAFNEAVNILNDEIVENTNTEDNNDELGYGSYFQIRREFSFIDLPYLGDLFDDDSVMKLVGLANTSENNTSTEKISRQQRRQIQREAAKKTIDRSAEEKSQNSTTNNISAIISAIRKIAPYEKMLVSTDGFMIPLNERYFRIDSKDLGFRYGGPTNCLGFVTNIINNVGKPDTDNMFMMLQQSVNNAFKEFLPTKASRILVCHPIAVYYDSAQ